MPSSWASSDSWTHMGPPCATRLQSKVHVIPQLLLFSPVLPVISPTVYISLSPSLCLCSFFLSFCGHLHPRRALSPSAPFSGPFCLHLSVLPGALAKTAVGSSVAVLPGFFALDSPNGQVCACCEVNKNSSITATLNGQPNETIVWVAGLLCYCFSAMWYPLEPPACRLGASSRCGTSKHLTAQKRGRSAGSHYVRAGAIGRIPPGAQLGAPLSSSWAPK